MILVCNKCDNCYYNLTNARGRFSRTSNGRTGDKYISSSRLESGTCRHTSGRFDPSYTHVRNLPTVTILVRRAPPNVYNEPVEYVETNMQTLTKKHNSFELIESVPSILGANNAHRATYILGGIKHCSIATIIGNRIYNVIYRSNPEEYSQYLPIAERMMASFKFLS